MNTFETAAIISLVDHLSAPLRSVMTNVAGHETTLARHAQRMADTGRHLTYQMTVPVLAGMKSMADKAVEFSKVENTLQGVLENRARTMQGLTTTTKEFAEAQVRAMRAASDAAYATGNGLGRGLINPLEYQKSVMEAARAGFTELDTNDPTKSMAPAIALSNQAANLALGNRVELSKASEDLIALSNSFGIATKDAEGHALSVDKLNASYGRLADMMVTMKANSAMSSEDVFESLKLSAPLAHMAHLDPAVLAAISATQAEQGIKGSEASVAQRSLLMSLLGPKTTAAAGLKEIGVDLHKYQTMGAGLTPEGFVQAMKNQGYRVSAGAAHGIFSRMSGDDPDYINMTNDLGALLQRAGKNKNPIAPDQANKVVNAWLSRQATSTDAMGLIEDIRAHGGLTAAQWKMIGEGRQFARLNSIIGQQPAGSRDVFSFEMSRYFGEDWKNVLAHSREQGPTRDGTPVGAVYLGNAMRQAQEHAKGLEGAYTRIHNAMDQIVKVMNDNHAFDDLANLVTKFAGGLASLDPQTLRLLTDFALAAAAIGPAVWALGTFASALGALGRVGGLVRGAEAAAEALPRVAAMTKAGVEAVARSGLQVAEDTVKAARTQVAASGRALVDATSAAANAAEAEVRKTTAARAALVSENLAKTAAVEEKAIGDALLRAHANLNKTQDAARLASETLDIVGEKAGTAQRFLAEAKTQVAELGKVRGRSLSELGSMVKDHSEAFDNLAKRQDAAADAAERLARAEAHNAEAKWSAVKAAEEAEKIAQKVAPAVEKVGATKMDAAWAKMASNAADTVAKQTAEAAAKRGGLAGAKLTADGARAALTTAEEGLKSAQFAARIAALTAEINKPMLGGLPGVLGKLAAVAKGADIVSWPFMLADIGESKNPTTKWNAPYRWDQVPGWAALTEQSHRSAQEFRRDPEGARGRAMMAHNADMAQQQQKVDVSVTGQAEVVQHFELQVQPTPYFTGLIKRVENVAKMALGQGDDLAGSNAAKKPNAPAVWHGPH